MRSVQRTVASALLCAAVSALGLCGLANASTPADLEGCMYLTDSVTKSDGSILASGNSGAACGSKETGSPMLVQLTPDGSVDSSFANGGVKFLPPTVAEVFRDLLPARGNKAIIVFSDRLIRLNGNGSLDQSFGTGGTVTVGPHILDLATGSIGSAAIQKDGKIILAGGERVARLNADGHLDQSFGTGGVARTSNTGRNYGGSVAVDEAGGIVALSAEGYAIRFDSGGEEDLGFGGHGDGLAATPSPQSPSSMVAQGLVIRPTGEIHVHGSEFNPNFPSDYGAPSFGFLTILDSNGTFLSSRYLPGPGDVFAEDSSGDPVSSWVLGRSDYRPRFEFIRRQGDDSLFREFKPTRGGEAQVNGFEYSPQDDSFIAVGSASVGDDLGCMAECYLPSTLMTVVKVDAETFEPDPDFGVGGTVLIPENECPTGIGPPLPKPTTPWNRCRLDKPKVNVKLKFRHSRSRRPALFGTVRFKNAQQVPAFIGRRLKVRLPNRLRLNRGARKLAYARIQEGDGSPVPTFKGRMLTIETRPPDQTYEPYYDGDPPPDNPPKFTFGLRRGAIKTISRRVRTMRLNFRTTGVAFPTNNYEPDSPTYWSANSTKRTIRIRPVPKRRGHR